MPISDQTIPYEILIRFDDEGAPKGAHVQSRRRVIMDGEVLKDEILTAAPLQLEGFPTSAIMTTATQAALVQAAALNSQIETLTAAVTSWEADAQSAHTAKDAAVAAKNTAEQQVGQMEWQVSQTTAALATANSRIATLEAILAAAEAANTLP
ncbi:hypothetical protein [Rhizobium sp. Root483D2]|uniref:hypothetical protein n=1 Tax=Rhizobium sp. Root483D2 TaxID=1736545 RepID=UPI0007133E9E|nr:hypothetical protein [Rhizobium sp. Root483D2]KQY20216.1 hypothetical protein ASD32_07050 [Rhizobium sp. Root483D2]